jgi:lipopolysaccharide transport system permease protein
MKVESSTSPAPTLVIEPHRSLFDWKLREVWRYRDLLRMFIRRDFVANYKQTILGPLWFFIQPLLTTIVFTVIFGNIAGISTDGMPKILFYMSGITIWNYFSDCLTKTSTVFRDNQSLFGKVYFPRLIMPLTLVISGLIKFGIQFLLFAGFLIYFLVGTDANIKPNEYMLLTPYLLLLMAMISMGAGMIISALTTKYRDLVFLMTFGVQLLMYATPVIYPISALRDKMLPIGEGGISAARLIELNPLSGIVETFRFAFLGAGDSAVQSGVQAGAGEFSWMLLVYSSVFAIVMLAVGTLIFNKVERSFIDTV